MDQKNDSDEQIVLAVGTNLLVDQDLPTASLDAWFVASLILWHIF